MVSDVDRTIERANGTLERVRARVVTPGKRSLQRQLRRAKRATAIGVGGAFTVLLIALIIGIFQPLGTLGILAVMLAMMMVMSAAVLFSREADISADTIGQASLPQIADRTDRWLDQQRRALPAPAQILTDSIGRRLASFGSQLETLDASGPQAHELRRLVGEELPDLVTRYRRVPEPLRRTERNGRVAESDLIDGLKLLDRQIDDLGQSLAATDMDRLSSHKRYLELRYEGDAEGSGGPNPPLP